MKYLVEYNAIQDAWHIDDYETIIETNILCCMKRRENFWVLMASANTYEEAAIKKNELEKIIKSTRSFLDKLKE